MYSVMPALSNAANGSSTSFIKASCSLPAKATSIPKLPLPPAISDCGLNKEYNEISTQPLSR